MWSGAKQVVKSNLTKGPHCHMDGSLDTVQWAAPFPLKIAPSHGDLDPHLIHGS